jgi:hypothetical protein
VWKTAAWVDGWSRWTKYTVMTWWTKLRSQILQWIPSGLHVTFDVFSYISHSEHLPFTLALTKTPRPYIFCVVQTTTMFNSTTTALTHIAHAPVRLLVSIPRPHFSYVPAAHVKLKADSIAMVLFCIARQIWMYVEGWRDSKWRRKWAREEKADDEKRDRKRRRGARTRIGGRGRKGGRIVLKGRYTLVLQ